MRRLIVHPCGLPEQTALFCVCPTAEGGGTLRTPTANTLLIAISPHSCEWRRGVLARRRGHERGQEEARPLMTAPSAVSAILRLALQMSNHRELP